MSEANESNESNEFNLTHFEQFELVTGWLMLNFFHDVTEFTQFRQSFIRNTYGYFNENFHKLLRNSFEASTLEIYDITFDDVIYFLCDLLRIPAIDDGDDDFDIFKYFLENQHVLCLNISQTINIPTEHINFQSYVENSYLLISKEFNTSNIPIEQKNELIKLMKYVISPTTIEPYNVRNSFYNMMFLYQFIHINIKNKEKVLVSTESKESTNGIEKNLISNLVLIIKNLEKKVASLEKNSCSLPMIKEIEIRLNDCVTFSNKLHSDSQVLIREINALRRLIEDQNNVLFSHIASGR